MTKRRAGKSEPQVCVLGDCKLYLHDEFTVNIQSKMHWRKTNKLCIDFARKRTPSRSLLLVHLHAFVLYNIRARLVEASLAVSFGLRFASK